MGLKLDGFPELTKEEKEQNRKKLAEEIAKTAKATLAPYEEIAKTAKAALAPYEEMKKIKPFEIEPTYPLINHRWEKEEIMTRENQKNSNITIYHNEKVINQNGLSNKAEMDVKKTSSKGFLQTVFEWIKKLFQK